MTLVLEQQVPAQTQESNAGIREWLRKCPVVSPNMLCGELTEWFQRESELECAVVCDAERRPLGLVMRHRFFKALGSIFGLSLYASKTISHLMEKNPYIAEVSVSPRDLIDGALSRNEDTFYDAAVITNQGKLAGILTVRDLLQLSRVLQKEAAENQIRTARKAEEMIRQISHAGQKVAAASREMSTCHDEITENAELGRRDLEGMLRLFRQWSENAGMQEKAVYELTQRFAAVNKITSLISEVANQCNLLAVNATIEAARAGESGRGFSIVAREIHELANRTKQFAGQIHDLLQLMTEAVEESVQLVQEGKLGADQGVDQVRFAEETFANLWDSSARSKEAASRLLRTSYEAAEITDEVLHEISRLVSQMNDVQV